MGTWLLGRICWSQFVMSLHQQCYLGLPAQDLFRGCRCGDQGSLNHVVQLWSLESKTLWSLN
eukprot:4492241-Amphidinium_carterae.1